LLILQVYRKTASEAEQRIGIEKVHKVLLFLLRPTARDVDCVTKIRQGLVVRESACLMEKDCAAIGHPKPVVKGRT
jgi:hypothetical protein